MMKYLGAIVALTAAVKAHGDHEQEPMAGPHKSLWYNTLPGDGGTQVFMGKQVSMAMKPLTFKQADSVFSGISTFGRLPYSPCLSSLDEKYDIAFIGLL